MTGTDEKDMLGPFHQSGFDPRMTAGADTVARLKEKEI